MYKQVQSIEIIEQKYQSIIEQGRTSGYMALILPPLKCPSSLLYPYFSSLPSLTSMATPMHTSSVSLALLSLC